MVLRNEWSWFVSLNERMLLGKEHGSEIVLIGKALASGAFQGAFFRCYGFSGQIP